MLTLPASSRPATTLTLARGGDPDRFLRSLVSAPGDVWALSHTGLHITDVIAHAIRVHGPGVACHLAFFWLSERHAEDVVGMVRSGRISRIRLQLNQDMLERRDTWDRTRASLRVDPGRGTASARILEQYLPAGVVVWRETHAKAIALRWPSGRCLALVTSQADPSSQTEWWHASTDPSVYAWLVSTLETDAQDRLVPDVELACRIQRTPYERERSAQDVRRLLSSSACRVSLPDGTSYLVGGPKLPSIALLAGVAVQMPEPPTVRLAGWWFAQRAINSFDLLERAGVIQAPHYVASHVLDGVYGDGQAAEHFTRMIPPSRRRFDDVHAKLALLESPGVSPVLIASTGNWQPTQPRAEVYVVTRDTSACEFARQWLGQSVARGVQRGR